MGMKAILSGGILPTDDQLRQVDSWLWRVHLHTITNDERNLLVQLCERLGLDEAECQERLQAILARKAARKAAMAEPAFVDAGVVLAPLVVTDRFLKHDDPNGRGIEQFLIDGGKQLPNLTAIRWHRWPSDSEEMFEYLLGVVTDLAAGELKPGLVAYCIRRGERYDPTGHSFPQFVSDSPPMNFRIEQWAFIRRPGQTQESLDAAVAELQKSTMNERTINGVF